ncbi:hypothetical protein KPZU09_63020 [Klebsiella pneumoniae]|uniref:Uncharacterized protein n=1 Tax=Klebsiella pneumoniae TaxID=573 RepID=A0A919I632_KLEPN|nr:hypothetical protein KPZU09_63020 [Klebsiella pneumoniae]
MTQAAFAYGHLQLTLAALKLSKNLTSFAHHARIAHPTVSPHEPVTPLPKLHQQSGVAFAVYDQASGITVLSGI